MSILPRISLWWNRLYLRKDEFHKSLEHNYYVYKHLNKEGQEWYNKDLVIRRNKKHN